MKKFVIILLVILIVALLLVTGNLYYKINEKELSATEQTQKMEELENKIAELENEISEQEEVEVKEDIETDDEVSSEDVEFNSDKMKAKSEGMTYRTMEVLNGHGGIEVEIRSGKAYLTTNPNDEMFKTHYFSDVKESVENKEITGFSTKIKEVHYGYLGDTNLAPVPTLFFLMEDGTVEYVDTEKMIKNENYKSFGKIKQVSDIVKFVDVAVEDVDENGESYEGTSSVVAIDKDGYAYDLNELM